MTIHGKLEILHEEADFVIISKPGGLLSVPGRGADKQDCVMRRLQEIYPAMIEQPSVHRLDMYTSGLMVVAITSEAHRNLNKQFENRTVKKEYTALLEGNVEGDSGEINLPFRVDIDNRPYQMYDPVHGKLGTTKWKILGWENGYTRILFTPLTGRTHQLRVHSAHDKGLGFPIVGDSLYGSGKDGERMMLHASLLAFDHPRSDERVEFISTPPF